MPSIGRTARIAGVLYFVMAVLGIVSYMVMCRG